MIARLFTAGFALGGLSALVGWPVLIGAGLGLVVLWLVLPGPGAGLSPPKASGRQLSEMLARYTEAERTRASAPGETSP